MNHFPKILFFLLSLLLPFFTYAGSKECSLDVLGNTRTFLLYQPPNLPPVSERPVIIAFHGGGTNANSMERFTGLNELADQKGFLVVYPNGSGRLNLIRTWNSGSCIGYAKEKNLSRKFLRLGQGNPGGLDQNQSG